MIVINLWGAPSSGKSTNAAGLYYLMKINKFKVELIHEFVKDLIWEEHLSIIGDQNYIFANQNRMLARLDGKVDYAITDSPLPLSCYYAQKEYLKKYPSFIDVVWENFNSYKNINILLTQGHDFENYGRIHDENQAREIQKDLKNILADNSIVHYEARTNPDLINEIFQIIYEIDKHKSDFSHATNDGIFQRRKMEKEIKKNMDKDNISLIKV